MNDDHALASIFVTDLFEVFMSDYVPTIDDLRVKLCFICREEEHYDKPEDPPQTWVHPCQCTLVAHQSCLLQWVSTAESSGRRENGRKCPQCGTKYEIESENPLILRLLRTGSNTLRSLGLAAFFAGLGSTALVIGGGAMWMLTEYGSFAVKEFLGPEVHALFLGRDYTRWPLMAFIYLPLIPIRLVTSRMGGAGYLPIIAGFVDMSATLFASRSSRHRSNSNSNSHGQQPPRAPGVEYTFTPRSGTNANAPSGNANANTITDHLSANALWPPSPLFFSFLVFPLARWVYRQSIRALSRRVLGDSIKQLAKLEAEADEQVLIVRIRGLGDDGGVFPDEDGNGDNDNNENVRGGRDGEVAAQAEGQAADGNPNPEEQVPPAPALPVDAEPLVPVAAENANPNANPQPAAANPAVPANPAAAANNRNVNRPIGIVVAQLGRHIAGALLTPIIANKMGHLLLRLSKHSVGLRKFLAVKPKWDPAQGLVDVDVGLGLGAGLVRDWRVLVRVLVGGLGAWQHLDPVWWRNIVGYGLFVAAKDCIRLLRLWLMKRELESRRVRNRDFAGVDMSTLNLRPDFPLPRRVGVSFA